MPIIHELSAHMADLIAAGEVVERPASVAKELIENAIDAGATRVTVEIEHGGVSYLRIADNGCGMSEEDAPVAFRRHATSKLRTEADLSAIRTLGFRGEALAAISAVSRIDLFTKQKGTLAGLHLHLTAGEIDTHEPAGCPDGTTLIIRDLFYNTPARMKFLKKDFTEAGYVAGVVQHAALSHPEISFTLLRDGKQIFATPGSGQLLAPVFAVFGREMTADMIELAPFARGGMQVWGFVTKPHAGRANRSMQHFFVNGRYVKSRLMQAALEEAYRNRIITGKYPSGALFLELPVHLVDVNVHPAKTEVKFAMEKDVFEIVYAACRNAIETHDNVPELRADAPRTRAPREDNLSAAQQRLDAAPAPAAAAATTTTPVSAPTPAPSAPVRALPLRQTALKKPYIDADLDEEDEDARPLDRRYLPRAFHSPAQEQAYRAEAERARVGAAPTPDTRIEESAPEVRAQSVSVDVPPAPDTRIEESAPEVRAQSVPADAPSTPDAPIEERAPEVRAQSVPADVPSAPMTPAQARQQTGAQTAPPSGARVLGEAFCTYILAEDADGLLLIDKHAAHERMLFNLLRRTADIPRQELLTPVVTEVTAAEAAALEEQLEDIRQIGFDLSPFGHNSFAVRAVPAYLDAADLPAVLAEMAGKLLDRRAPTPDRLDDLIHTVSCKAAIKAGRAASLAELQQFCDRVLADPEITCCPHGRPVTVRLRKYEIDKLFKRVNQ